MPLQDGGKATMWSFDDRGSYAIAKLTAQTKTANGYDTDFSHNCLIVDQAYKNLAGTKINEEAREHVDIRIGHIYKRTSANGKEFDQSPFTVSCKWNKERQKEDITVKVFNADLIKAHTAKAEEPAPVEAPSPAPVAQQETPKPTPAQSGFVGLDFLNIPDGFGNNSDLPFK